MADDAQTDTNAQGDGDPGGGQRRSSAWDTGLVVLVPAVTFVIGLVLGLVVTRAVDTDADPAAEPGDASSSSTAVVVENGDTVVTVPGACEDAAENITEATRLLDDVAGTVRDFKPDELVDLINQLEDIDAQTRPLAKECAELSVTEEPAPSPSD